jgi:hypothetical protein
VAIPSPIEVDPTRQKLAGQPQPVDLCEETRNYPCSI